MRKVIVASKNPVKINAVKDGFEKMFPSEEFVVEGASVSSNVSDQPLSNQETLQGAFNRADGAKKAFPQADFWVGVEGGVEKMGDDMAAFARVVVRANTERGSVGKARSATFFLPPKVVELIDQGMELGEADDIVFGRSNSKQKNGAVGILTGDVIDRKSYYTEAVVLALIPAKNKELY